MAWTAPKTFVSGAVLTKADLDTYLKANLEATFPGLATTDNQYMISTGANTAAVRKVSQARTETSETTVATAYGDLSGGATGPAVTVTTGTSALVLICCNCNNNTANADARMSVAVSSATTIAASDNYRVTASDPVASAWMGSYVAVLFDSNLTAGSNIFTAKYRVSAGTGTFIYRELIVYPF